MKSIAFAAAIAVALAVLVVPAASAQETYYANCQAVRDAGKAPLKKGDPGYRAALDRDGDGIACEVTGTTPPTTTTKPPVPTSTTTPPKPTTTTKTSTDSKTSTATKTEQATAAKTSTATRERWVYVGESNGSYGQVGSNRVPVGGVATGG